MFHFNLSARRQSCIMHFFTGRRPPATAHFPFTSHKSRITRLTAIVGAPTFATVTNLLAWAYN
jgi:hypothetical protein